MLAFGNLCPILATFMKPWKYAKIKIFLRVILLDDLKDSSNFCGKVILSTFYKRGIGNKMGMALEVRVSDSSPPVPDPSSATNQGQGTPTPPQALGKNCRADGKWKRGPLGRVQAVRRSRASEEGPPALCPRFLPFTRTDHREAAPLWHTLGATRASATHMHNCAPPEHAGCIERRPTAWTDRQHSPRRAAFSPLLPKGTQHLEILSNSPK